MTNVLNVKVYDLKESVIASGNAMRLEPVLYTDEEFEKGIERCAKLAKMGGGSGHTNFRKGIRVSFDLVYTQYITKQLQRYSFFDYVSSSSLMHRITKMDFRKCTTKYVATIEKQLMVMLVDMYNVIQAKDNINQSVVDAYKVFLTKLYDEEDLQDIDNINSSNILYDCYMRIINCCPMGTELFVRVSTNYEQLATIYKQRKNHKLKEDWSPIINMIKNLPYAKELIICNE